MSLDYIEQSTRAQAKALLKDLHQFEKLSGKFKRMTDRYQHTDTHIANAITVSQFEKVTHLPDLSNWFTNIDTINEKILNLKNEKSNTTDNLIGTIRSFNDFTMDYKTVIDKVDSHVEHHDALFLDNIKQISHLGINASRLNYTKSILSTTSVIKHVSKHIDAIDTQLSEQTQNNLQSIHDAIAEMKSSFESLQNNVNETIVVANDFKTRIHQIDSNISDLRIDSDDVSNSELNALQVLLQSVDGKPIEHVPFHERPLFEILTEDVDEQTEVVVPVTDELKEQLETNSQPKVGNELLDNWTPMEVPKSPEKKGFFSRLFER